MPSILDTRGVGAIRALLTLAVVVTMIYVGIKFVPVRAAAFRFDDTVREQVVLAGSTRRRVTEQQIRSLLVERAVELGLPVSGRDIAVRRSRTEVSIEVKYTVPIEMIFGFTYDWEFDVSYSGPSF